MRRNNVIHQSVTPTSVPYFRGVLEFCQPDYIQGVSVAGSWDEIAGVLSETDTVLYNPYLYVTPVERYDMRNVGGTAYVRIVANIDEALRNDPDLRLYEPAGDFCGGFRVLDFDYRIFRNVAPNPVGDIVRVNRDVIVREVADERIEHIECDAEKHSWRRIDADDKTCDEIARTLVALFKKEDVSARYRNLAAMYLLNTVECVMCDEVREYAMRLREYLQVNK